VEMADVQKKETTGEPEDVKMTETTNMTANEIGTETGAQATNDERDQAQLCQVVRVDHCGAADGSQTKGGCTLLSGATERKRWFWDQPLGM
jgi:hypothetical protein